MGGAVPTMLKIFSQSSFTQANLKFSSHSNRFHLTVCIPYTRPALVRGSAEEFQWKELKRRVKEPRVNRGCFRIASSSLATWCGNAEQTIEVDASVMSHFVSRVPDGLVGEIRSPTGIRRRRRENGDRWRVEFFFFLPKRWWNQEYTFHFYEIRESSRITTMKMSLINESQTRWIVVFAECGNLKRVLIANPILGIYTRARAPVRNRSPKRLNIRHSIPTIINPTLSSSRRDHWVRAYPPTYQSRLSRLMA